MAYNSTNESSDQRWLFRVQAFILPFGEYPYSYDQNRGNATIGQNLYPEKSKGNLVKRKRKTKCGSTSCPHKNGVKFQNSKDKLYVKDCMKKNPSIQWHQTKLHERTMPIIISIIQSKNPSKYGHNHSFFAWTQSIPFFHVWNLYTTQSFLANKNTKPHVTLKKRFVNKNLEAEQKRKKELTSFFVHLLWIQDQLFALYPLLPLWEWTKSKRTQAASPQTFTTHKRKDQKDYILGHPRTKSREEKKGEEEELPVTHKNVKGHNEEPSDCARSA